jgi:hypothetical protein
MKKGSDDSIKRKVLDLIKGATERPDETRVEIAGASIVIRASSVHIYNGLHPRTWPDPKD